jgi:hypothetical protein
MDGNAATTEAVPLTSAPYQTLDIVFPTPFASQSLTVSLDTYLAGIRGTLSVSDDGKSFRDLRPVAFTWPTSSFNFEKVTARWFRLTYRTEGLAPKDQLPIGEIELSGARKIEGIAAKAAFIDEPFLSGTAGAPAASIRRERILDITGRDTWSVPAGNWTVLRIGYTTKGKTNHPAPEESLGLECDRLSRRAVDVHFAGLMEKLLDEQRATGTRALRGVHIDSWESGSQNWSPEFKGEFRRLRGYDLTKYLPALTGRAVGSQEVSERFLWDLRRTVKDLLLENYAARFRELAHQHGLQLSIEGYGNGPLDDLRYAGLADIPMGEFWMGVEPWWVNRQMASAAHTYGRPIVGAEAFTAHSFAGKWTNHPFRMKPLGDQMFTHGVNRFVIHRYAMQPWSNRVPGMTMGPYGVHFERTNTWWEQSKPWLEYLARCQFLLQQGTFVADIAYLDRKRVPNDTPEPHNVNLPSPPGYDYDSVSSDLLSRMTVRDGRIALPSGASYRVLVLPMSTTLPVAQLRRIRELVQAGAVVVGAPPVGSPSLGEGTAGDAEVRRLAAELWADVDGERSTEHRFGSGRVVWGQPLSRVLSETGLIPDFVCSGAEVGRHVRYIHRVAEGRDVYFLASSDAQSRTFNCSFRVTGKSPELWHPDSGHGERLAHYQEQGGRTRVPVRLDPYGSAFIIFSPPTVGTPPPLTRISRDGVDVSGLPVEMAGAGYRIVTDAGGAYRFTAAGGRSIEATVPPLPEPAVVTGPWNVTFPSGWGAPPEITVDRLISWTTHPMPGVKFFSGSATYRKRLEVPAGLLDRALKLYLDLGRVEVIAEVKLNGRDLGVLWKPPFRVDITQAVRSGGNDLEIRVVNLWPNRMIGDELLPERAEREGTRLKSWPSWLLGAAPSPSGRHTFASWNPWRKDDPLLESGLLGPVVLHPAVQIDLQ